MIPCIRCHGSRISIHEAWTDSEGKVYPERRYECPSCNGRGVFYPINIEKLVKAILVSQGKTKGRLKAAFPSAGQYKGQDEARAYYVWRMARFHSGKDMTWPVMAQMDIGGDPYREELDAIADKVAQHCFGTNMVAAMTWGKALGVIQ